MKKRKVVVATVLTMVLVLNVCLLTACGMSDASKDLQKYIKDNGTYDKPTKTTSISLGYNMSLSVVKVSATSNEVRLIDKDNDKYLYINLNSYLSKGYIWRMTINNDSKTYEVSGYVNAKKYTLLDTSNSENITKIFGEGVPEEYRESMTSIAEHSINKLIPLFLSYLRDHNINNLNAKSFNFDNVA